MPGAVTVTGTVGGPAIDGPENLAATAETEGCSLRAPLEVITSRAVNWLDAV